MLRRERRADCCSAPIDPPPLPAAERARLLARCKALGDASRLDILWLIAAQEEPMCACDVVERFALSQPTISHHLKVLAEAGLIRVSRRGVWAYYALDAESAPFVQTLFGHRLPVQSGAS